MNEPLFLFDRFKKVRENTLQKNQFIITELYQRSLVLIFQQFYLSC